MTTSVISEPDKPIITEPPSGMNKFPFLHGTPLVKGGMKKRKSRKQKRKTRHNKNGGRNKTLRRRV